MIETYLDIKIGTGQLMTPSEFIDYYENRELKLTTPISNQFLGREEELKQGLKKLCENNILIISGKSGVGNPDMHWKSAIYFLIPIHLINSCALGIKEYPYMKTFMLYCLIHKIIYFWLMMRIG